MQTNQAPVIETVLLNNGIHMPVLGLGVYQIPNGGPAEQATLLALELGYRLIDTAALYGNEKDVGNAVRHSGIPREEIFVTTKLLPMNIFNAESAFNTSLKKMGLDYIDLYLIHWPFVRTKKIWKEFEQIYKQGRVRAIGVSNFGMQDLEELLATAEVVPAVNQVEFHPFFYQRNLLEYCVSKHIQIEAHTPLTRGQHLHDPILEALARNYGKSVAQVLIRWGLDHGLIVIPKTTHRERMKENLETLYFSLGQTDREALDRIETIDPVAWLTRFKADPKKRG